MRASTWLCLVLTVACGNKDDDNDDIYDTCDDAEQCDAPDDLEPACLSTSGDGFCSHTCDVDEDCAPTSVDYVCASFESEPGTYCFPSCEEGDDVCPRGLGCRSTGGGSENRKICFPE